MFKTPIEDADGVLAGPVRQPRQMLNEQEYDGHASLHDDDMARTLGFRRGTIEGPTHFSQFVPLCCKVWGDDWLRHGCLSAHYRAPAYDEDDVRAFLRWPPGDGAQAEIWMLNASGTEILRGTASIGPDFPATALDNRLAQLAPLTEPVILRDVKVGARVDRVPVRMTAQGNMGALYPFSLADKLRVITEPSPAYCSSDNQWQRPIIPFEMISVLMQYSWDDKTVGMRGPAVGLFADQEIRLLDGPLFVDEPYELDREVVFLSGSRRTESVWVRSRLFRPGEQQAVAIMLLNAAFMKESYAPYEKERVELYGGQANG